MSLILNTAGVVRQLTNENRSRSEDEGYLNIPFKCICQPFRSALLPENI